MITIPPLRRPLFLGAALSAVLTASCTLDEGPVAPGAGEDAARVPVDLPTQDFLKAPVHVMESGVFDLISRSDSLGGVYRYRVVSSDAPVIARDEFIVGQDDRPFLRRVLRADRVGDEIEIETSVAYWHEIIEGGTYEATIPLGDGPALHNPVGLDGAGPLPPLNLPLGGIDVCARTDSLLALIPGNTERHLCGEERDFAVAVGVVSVTVDGTITELLIDEGNIGVTGTMATSVTIDAGGLSGGRRPTFSPCNRAAYPGCLTTPTGAALIDWLRRYAPQIPDGSLAPNRVCVPLTPIRVRAGYWDFSGIIPRWVLPVFEVCHVSDIGELPTIELPSLEQLSIIQRPNIKGHMVMDLGGQGGLELKITVPPAGATAGARFGEKLSLKGTLGFFITVDVDMSEAGARVALDFDEDLVITQAWTSDAGWTGDVDLTGHDVGGDIDLIGPDSVRVRAGITAEITGVACAALIGKCELEEEPDSADGGGFSLKLGAEVKAVFFTFEDAQWSRTPTDNWMVDVDWANELTLGAGLQLPNDWEPPNRDIEWAPEPFEFGRVDMGNIYGTGRLRITTATSGASPDTDGYEVRIERADTLPPRIEGGAQRLGPLALDLGFPIHRALGANDNRLVNPIKTLPCEIQYTDFLLLGPVSGVLARRDGLIDFPNYALTYPCQLLVADHTVTLQGVAENCVVTGGATQTIALQQRNVLAGRSDEVTAAFLIECSPPTVPLGSLDVTTVLTGSEPDENGYTIEVGTVGWGPIGVEDTRSLAGLTPGLREVSLTDIADNCTVVGGNAVGVDVPSGGTGAVTFEVDCSVTPTPQGAVRVSTTVTGPTPDPDGFLLSLDGRLTGVIDAGSDLNLPGLVAGEAAVLYMGGIAENCRLDGLSPTTVMLDPVDMTAAAPFDISCTDSPITSVTGSVFVTAFPMPAATLREEDGTTWRLAGGLAAELVNMSGVLVTAHGVVTDGSLDVYGYAVGAGEDIDERHVGIVMERDGEFWLFGDAAVQLIDAPSRLVEQVGRLVWIAGREVPDGVVPEAFGIIREGS